ncbi:type II secretion system minor pseudopilin GspI [Paraferrimonas sp. SM1919]|uniref:type II secretion system minor pseudopilin GspI n=1 Tax=Paraferrimonas sp. SM1919 TaxID=2662263 RepID=UPI0013D48551|nr:type II secretion system minor pseudopilin GspI [Paraferrimonas sp. SM1919]
MAKQQGLTLLEVLVAMAVFATAASAVMSSLSTQTRNLPKLEQRTFASWVANNQMVEIRLTEKFPAIGEKRGEVEQLGETWYWRQNVVKTMDDKFRRINISVSPNQNMNPVVVELSSYVSDNN